MRTRGQAAARRAHSRRWECFHLSPARCCCRCRLLVPRGLSSQLRGINRAFSLTRISLVGVARAERAFTLDRAGSLTDSDARRKQRHDSPARYTYNTRFRSLVESDGLATLFFFYGATSYDTRSRNIHTPFSCNAMLLSFSYLPYASSSKSRLSRGFISQNCTTGHAPGTHPSTASSLLFFGSIYCLFILYLLGLNFPIDA